VLPGGFEFWPGVIAAAARATRRASGGG